MMDKKDTSDKFNAVPDDFVFLDKGVDTKQPDKIDDAKRILGIK